MVEFLGEGLTYDDVLLVPQMASALPRDVETRTRFCRGVILQTPIASAAMIWVCRLAPPSGCPDRGSTLKPPLPYPAP